MNDEVALNYIIYWLREWPLSSYQTYGYDIYLPGIIRKYVETHENLRGLEGAPREQEISPHFYTAAWELCRRGILRPGVRIMGAQATVEGSSGDGYSVTPFGKTWVEESNRDDFVPTEPGRFATMLKPFHTRYGSGFYERGQEAIRCYGAHAYLACCAMCGAAAESILLAVAIAKTDEASVLKTYRSAQGRSRIENLIFGKARKQLQTEFRGFSSLLKYWRDEAAHGKTSGITDNEAYTSLALLLRFAIYTDECWDELTSA